MKHHTGKVFKESLLFLTAVCEHTIFSKISIKKKKATGMEAKRKGKGPSTNSEELQHVEVR